MPQTIEAIDHTKAAGVPMIVAINKMDKPEQSTHPQLPAEHEVIEKMSGDVQDVEISAKEKTGLDELFKRSPAAELLELKANPDRMAEATVIEAQRQGPCPVATVLTRGTLERGNTVAGRRAAVSVRSSTTESKSRRPALRPVEVLPAASLRGRRAHRGRKRTACPRSCRIVRKSNRKAHRSRTDRFDDVPNLASNVSNSRYW